MNPKYEIEVAYPFWVAYKANMFLILHTPRRLIASLLFPLAALFLIAVWLLSGENPAFSDYLLIFFLLFFMPIIMLYSVYISRKKNGLAKGPFKYRFGSDGINCSNENFDLTIKWKSILKAKLTKEFLFIFTSPSCAHCIPIADIEKTCKIGELFQFVNNFSKA